jgi:hypothetical protein
MKIKTIMASLNKVANELDSNGLYTEANTVTKVMSKIAMDENDENGSMEDMGYCPECHEFSLIDGKCEQCGHGEDDDSTGFSHRDMYEGFDEVADMMDPMGTSNKPDDLLSHHAKDYNNPKISDLAVVFDELDHMIRENDMLTPEQLRRYRQIKSRLMNS